MKILLRSGCTPKGFGIGYDDEQIYAVSPCCREVVITSWDDAANPGYRCFSCDGFTTKDFINENVENVFWSPTMPLKVIHRRNVEMPHDTLSAEWAKAWTGVSDLQFQIEGVEVR